MARTAPPMSQRLFSNSRPTHCVHLGVHLGEAVLADDGVAVPTSREVGSGKSNGPQGRRLASGRPCPCWPRQPDNVPPACRRPIEDVEGEGGLGAASPPLSWTSCSMLPPAIMTVIRSEPALQRPCRLVDRASTRPRILLRGRRRARQGSPLVPLAARRRDNISAVGLALSCPLISCRRVDPRRLPIAPARGGRLDRRTRRCIPTAVRLVPSRSLHRPLLLDRPWRERRAGRPV